MSLKTFLKYASLSVLGTLGVSCYILADTYFISKGLGTRGLAALNIAIPVYNFIHGSGLMFGMGGATKFSICHSSGEHQKLNTIFSHTICLALSFGLCFSLMGLFFSRELATLLGANIEILEMTSTYLKWLLFFAPAFMMNDVLLCYVRNDHSPKLASIAMLIGSFSNIILDYLFIFPLNLGIFGAVFATGLSPLISMLVMSLHWIKKKNTIHLVSFKIDWKMILQNLSLGFPSLIDQVAVGVVMIVFNYLILGLEGNVGIAAYGVTANIALVVSGIYTGIAQGVQPLLSSAYGLQDQKGIQLNLKYAFISIVCISILIYGVIYVYASPITSIFNSENNMMMQKISVTGLKIYFTSVLFVGFNLIIAVYFTSTQKVIPAHVLSLLRGFILIVPLAFILSTIFKMTGVWLTYPLSEGIVAILSFILYKKIKI